MDWKVREIERLTEETKIKRWAGKSEEIKRLGGESA